MATSAVKLPTAGAGPLSLIMPPAGPDDDTGSGLGSPGGMSGALGSAFNDLLASARHSPEDKFKDESLAFAGGMSDPSGNGTFGGALTNAFKSQSAQRTKDRELQMQYLPTVVNALAQQQQLQMQQAQMRQLQQMLGGEGGGGGFVDNLSRKYGIPREAIISDIAFNGGKNIREMVYKQGTPDVAMNDGVAYDKTDLGHRLANTGAYAPGGAGGMGSMPGQPRPGMPGMAGQPPGMQGGAIFMPGVTTSANGTTTVRTPNGRGGVDISVPNGALDAVRDFSAAQARGTGSEEPDQITPRNGPPQLVTKARKAEIARQGPVRDDSTILPTAGTVPAEAFKGMPAPQPGMTSSFTGSPETIMAAIANMKDPQERSNALDAYTRQQNGVQGLQDRMKKAQDSGDMAEAQRLRTLIEQQSQPPGQYGVELQSPAEAKRQAEAVEGENKKYVNDQSEMRRARTAVDQLDKAMDLLKKNPTASGLGSMRDDAYAFFGKESDSAATSRQLSTLQGWLTSNVPRMEGPQSDFDVMNYKQMTGMVGNEKLPINVRMAAARQAQQLIKDAAPKTFGEAWNKTDIPTGGTTPFQISPDIIKAERARRQGAK